MNRVSRERSYRHTRTPGEWRAAWIACIGALALFVSGCASQPAGGGVSTGVIQVVAGENFWGSIASQLGGSHAQVNSIISDPNADPHQYQTNTQTARAFASAQYVILNGAGYDAWANNVMNANPVSGRKVFTIAELLGKKEGDNPHFWYNPDYVMQVANQITHDYKSLDPADASYFDQQNAHFLNTALKPYHDRLAAIKAKFAGRKVGSTESLFVYMAQYLGLDLISPPDFMNAVSEGNDPPAASVATFQQQVQQKQITLLVYDVQTSTNVTNSMRQAATQQHIPVVGVSETLQPAGATFQDWQVAQLTTLQNALNSSALIQ